jgi:hypothetical protein
MMAMTWAPSSPPLVLLLMVVMTWTPTSPPLVSLKMIQWIRRNVS